MRKLRDIKKIFYIFLIIFLSFILIKKYLFYSILKDNHLPKNLKLQNGDIILRKESNRISDLFAAINNSEYSHIGTFLFIKNKPKIVHIEDDDYSNDYKISSPLKFMKYASHYAIYRPKNKINKERLFSIITLIKTKNPSFDINFKGDNNDNKLYCTELAYIINKNATLVDIKPKIETYINYKYISINSFTNKKYFKLLYIF